MKNDDTITITDIFTKKTYRVPDDKKGIMALYKNRYAIILSLSVLIRGFLLDLLPTVAFAISMTVLMEYIYRIRFLKKLDVLPKDAIPKSSVPRQAQIMNGCLYLILGVLLGAYSFNSSTTGTNYWILLAVAVGSITLSLTYLTSVFNSK